MAADSKSLQPFLCPQIRTNTHPQLEAAYGLGQVLNTGRIDTEKLLESYARHLIHRQYLIPETFDYGALRRAETHIAYKSVKARHIIFAEGYGLKQNPFFNYLPLRGSKGELLKIKSPELKERSIIKSAVFLIPLGEDLYRVGATYNWKDKSNAPTADARSELIEKLGTFLKCSYDVMEHTAGIRPTVADRRPLVGRHPQYENIYVLNGFGSRGVMIAPYAAEQLYGFIEHQEPLNPDMDVVRFRNKFSI
jgi:glycine/D-amino acid oxidase-like deaminating enzyme